jgi:putative ABC transport system ATP-binding protein
LIEVRGISKVYRIGKVEVTALHDINISIKRGEFASIAGPSGSGKSTLMNIIGCLDQPTDGTYILEGHNISDADQNALAEIRNKKIGFVFQTFNLLSRNTALENVELPLLYAGISHVKEQALDALEQVGLSHRAHHKPNELSGGERQRVAIARAIVLKPALILADEPTGNLDSKTGKEIMEIFRSLNSKGSTIVLVTHEKEIALYGERVIIIRDGRVRADKILKKGEGVLQNTSSNRVVN